MVMRPENDRVGTARESIGALDYSYLCGGHFPQHCAALGRGAEGAGLLTGDTLYAARWDGHLSYTSPCIAPARRFMDR